MEGKQWYASKTLWVNLIAIVALGIQSQTGFVIDGEIQGALLIVVNAILRLITKDKVALRNDNSTKIITYLIVGVSILPFALASPGCATSNPQPGTQLTAQQEAALTPEQALYYALDWYNSAWDKYHKVWLALSKEQKQEWLKKYHVKFQEAGRFLDAWALNPGSNAERLRWRAIKDQLETVLIQLAVK